MKEDELESFLARSRADLIRSLAKEGFLKSKAVKDALLTIPREVFLWPGKPISVAYFDEPIPLGDTGQTLSAPHMIVLMLEQLEIRPGMKVLEIGTGSGYNTALLARIISGNFHPKLISQPLVFSVERDPRLVSFARKNLEKVGLSRVAVIVEGDGSLGYPQQSVDEIYDRIIVTAGAPRVPSYLKKQLKQQGILEIPVGGMTTQKLLKLTKKGDDNFTEEKIIDCAFVPLIGQDSYPLS